MKFHQRPILTKYSDLAKGSAHASDTAVTQSQPLRTIYTSTMEQQLQARLTNKFPLFPRHPERSQYSSKVRPVLSLYLLKTNASLLPPHILITAHTTTGLPLVTPNQPEWILRVQHSTHEELVVLGTHLSV